MNKEYLYTVILLGHHETVADKSKVLVLARARNFLKLTDPMQLQQIH